MIVYWLLLLPTALFAYLVGSLDTLVLASNFVFHRNLRRLGDSRVWLSNFYRIYGIPGFVKLLVVELVRDALRPKYDHTLRMPPAKWREYDADVLRRACELGIEVDR